MLRPHDIVGRFAILTLGMAIAAGAQTPPPSKSSPQAPAKTAPTAAAPAKTAPSGAAPAKAPAKAAAKTPAKTAQVAKPVPAKPKPPVAQKPSKPAEKPAEQAQKKEEGATAAASHRRDPFLALISATAVNVPIHLPPGKAGLQVSTVHVEGIVRSQNGMMVVVTNPQGRTYFLHQGDRLFDGRVEQISMDSVTFSESGKDPFGKVIERTVVKRIYPSAGEQQ